MMLGVYHFRNFYIIEIFRFPPPLLRVGIPGRRRQDQNIRRFSPPPHTPPKHLITFNLIKYFSQTERKRRISIRIYLLRSWSHPPHPFFSLTPPIYFPSFSHYSTASSCLPSSTPNLRSLIGLLTDTFSFASLMEF